MALPMTAASANSPTAATCSAVEMPKPDGDRQPGETAQALDQAARIGGQVLLRPGNAYARDGIDESLGNIGNHFQAVIAAGRRSQKNRHQPVVVQLGQIFCGLFHDQVRDQHTVHAAMWQPGHKSAPAQSAEPD